MSDKDPNKPEPHDSGYDAEKNSPFDGAYEYPSVDHPEDRPDFGSASAHGGSNAGGSSYPGAGNAGGYPSGEYPGYGASIGSREVVGTHEDLQQPMVVNDGIVDVFEPFGYAFKVTFKRWGIWVTLGILFLLGTIGYVAWTMRGYDPSVPTSARPDYMDPMVLVAGLVSLLLAPLVMSLGLLQVSGNKFSPGEVTKGGRYGAGLGAMIVTSLISVVLLGLPSFLATSAITGEGAEAQIDWGIYGASMLAATVLSIFVLPLFQFAPYFALDGRAGVLGSVKQSIAAVRANYWLVVGFIVLYQIIIVALVMFTCGLGLIVLIGVSTNAMVFFYRQLVGGPVPRKV